MAKERFFEEGDLEARIARLEEQMGALGGDSTLRNLPYGTLKQAASSLDLRSMGNPLGGAYPAATLNGSISLTAFSLTANNLHAVPFYLPSPRTASRIGTYITINVSGNAHLGIYEDKGEDLLYPGKLKLDAGVVSHATTGVKGIDIKIGLPRGLYWLVILPSGSPQVRAIAIASAWTPLGCNESGTEYSIYRVAQAYGSLPSLFPAGAVEEAQNPPFIFLKFS